MQVQKSSNHTQDIILASNTTEKQSNALLEIVALDWHDKLNYKKSVKEAANQKRAIALKNRKENSRLSKGIALHNDACTDQNNNQDFTQPISPPLSPRKRQDTAFLDEIKLVTPEISEEIHPPTPFGVLSERKQSNFLNSSQTATFSSVAFTVSSVTDTTSIQNNNNDEDCQIFTSTSTAGILEDREYDEEIIRATKRRKLDPGLTIDTNFVSGAAAEKEEDKINEMVELPIICGRSPSRLIPSNSAMYFANFDDDEMDECDYDVMGEGDNFYDIELEGVENHKAAEEITSNGILPMQLPTETSVDTSSGKIEEVEGSHMLSSNAAPSVDKENNSGAFSKPPQAKRKYKKRIKAEGSNDLKKGTEKKASGKKASRTEENIESCDDDTVNSSSQQYEHGPWTDIYAKVKLFVCMAPRNLSNSDVMIRHANEDFFTNFGFDKSSTLPMPLKSLFGHGTSRMVLHKLHMALLTGKQAYEFINLYRADKRPLACHIVLVSVTGNRIREGARQSHPAPPNLEFQCQEKYAILTIRSASVIGNAKAYGIGFFGPGRITTVRPPLASNGPNEKQSQATKKENEHGHEVNGIIYANCTNSSDDDDESSQDEGDTSNIPILEYHPHHWSGQQPHATPRSNLVFAYPHQNHETQEDLQRQVSPAILYGHIPPALQYPHGPQSQERNCDYPSRNRICWGNTPDFTHCNNTTSNISSSSNNTSGEDNREYHHSLIPHNQYHNLHFPQNHQQQQHNSPHYFQSQPSPQYHIHHNHSQRHSSHNSNNHNNSHIQISPMFPASCQNQQHSLDSDNEGEDCSNLRLSYHHHLSTPLQQSAQPLYRSRLTSMIAQESLLSPRSTSELEQVRENTQRMHQCERVEDLSFHYRQQQQREYIR